MYKEYVEITDGAITKIVPQGTSYKNISFGKNATDQEYFDAGLYLLQKVSPEFTPLQTLGAEIVTVDEATKIATKTFEVLELSADERILKFEEEIGAYMDSQAQARGYDNIINASLRAGLPNSPYHAEGVAFGEWMDNVWDYSYKALAEVQSGTRTEPTIAEFIAELPPLVLP